MRRRILRQQDMSCDVVQHQHSLQVDIVRISATLQRRVGTLRREDVAAFQARLRDLVAEEKGSQARLAGIKSREQQIQASLASEKEYLSLLS